VPGCEQSSGTVDDLQLMCVAHFISTCYEELEEMQRSMRTWAFGGPDWESTRRFTQECSQAATNFIDQKRDLSNLERARLTDIALWATELGRQLRRSPRTPLSIAIRLVSDTPGRCWEENTITLDVNRHGARTICRNVANKGDILQIFRLDTGEQVESRVVWQRQTAPGAQEVGLETIGDKDFWIP
jgi:hypothetical protein